MESGDEQAMETPESAIDRISSLPTEILHNILSLVQIRSVVRMRRLSKWWRQLCESLQFICLNVKEFGTWTVKRFTRFVNNLLLRRANVDLHTFQLHWCRNRRSLNCNDVMMWIAYAVKNNVKVLDVELGLYHRTFLPHCVFTCPSLQELNLELGRVPDKINLPALRKLTLADARLSQLSLDQIITKSPGLEDLNLRNCAADFNLLDSKVLKTLTLHGLKCCLGKITVVAPHLIHFQCIDLPLKDISWREQLCLESAHIESLWHTFDGLSNFTGIILHTKRLKLLTGTDVKVMLEKELPTCSVFENLEFLQIGGWCLTDSLYIILRFLQLSPRLQTLILTHEEPELPEEGEGAEKDTMPSSEMTFGCPHLQTVIIQCSKYDSEIDGTGSSDALSSDGGSQTCGSVAHASATAQRVRGYPSEIDTIVNAIVDNGVSLEKIQVTTFHEDIRESSNSKLQKQEEEFGIFEKMLKENPEWADDSCCARSESDSSDDEEEESSNEDYDNESWDYDEDDDDDEIEDENDGDDETEDEDDDDDETEDEDDDDDETEDEDDGGKMEVEDDDG